VTLRGEKAERRQQLKARLGGMTPEARGRGSEELCGVLRGLEVVRRAETILAYLAMPEEISLDRLIEAVLAEGTTVCAPRADWDSGTMVAARLEDLEAGIVAGRHGLREPSSSSAAVDPRSIDVVLVPGLGFDARGGRLGRGGGFYDRFLSSLLGDAERATFVGVCFNAQVLDAVPMSAGDVMVDMVVTPTGVVGG
jgi:5-formyltetrahydrofolate cyclo-ligase